MREMAVGVIVAAGGRGARLGASSPKQLLDLGGRPLLARSVSVFDAHPRVSEIVVVLPAEHVAAGESLVGPMRCRARFVAGGARRQDSVRRGLDALSRDLDIVLVHDAARPFADRALVDRVIAAAETAGAAVPAIPARDTVKRVNRDDQVVRETIAREEIWLAQTPQGFRRDVLARAIAAGSEIAAATDEATLVERAGHAVRVVAGDERNVKITTADDLERARAWLGSGLTPVRVGTGYDLHTLVAGRALVLAGVTVPSDRGPLAHSDGDVVCHAIVDAMCGAAAAGDIGRLFPDTDAAWKDAPGLDLLSRAVQLIRERGLAVSSVDVTVLLERPALSPHVDAIRGRVAHALGIPVDRVGLKAKTNEGVDAVGRGDAIASHAVAVLGAGRDR